MADIPLVTYMSSLVAIAVPTAVAFYLDRRAIRRGIVNEIYRRTSEIEQRFPLVRKADYLWMGERALLGLAAVSELIDRPHARTTLTRLVRAPKNNLFHLDFFEKCRVELALLNSDPRLKHLYLWPLAELLEEAVDLGLARPKDRVFKKVFDLLVPIEGVLDYDRIWAIGRACQEIEERNQSDPVKTAVVDRIDKRITGKRRITREGQIVREYDDGATAIFNYCRQADAFEEIGLKDDISVSMERFLKAMLDLPTPAPGGTTILDSISCYMKGRDVLKSGSVDAINAWTDDVMKIVGTTPRWTAVSFLRRGLGYLRDQREEKLEPVAVHLLKHVDVNEWPVFQLIEIFEPVFFELVFCNGGQGVWENDFVEEVKNQLASGCDDANAPDHLIECCYGAATCIAELAEKGKFTNKSDAVELFKTELLSRAPESSARRRLLGEWLEFRLITYPKVLGIRN